MSSGREPPDEMGKKGVRLCMRWARDTDLSQSSLIQWEGERESQFDDGDAHSKLTQESPNTVSDVIEESGSGPSHKSGWDGINRVQDVRIFRDSEKDAHDPEVCSTQIQCQDKTGRITRWQTLDVSGEAFDVRGLVCRPVESLFDLRVQEQHDVAARLV